MNIKIRNTFAEITGASLAMIWMWLNLTEASLMTIQAVSKVLAQGIGGSIILIIALHIIFNILSSIITGQYEEDIDDDDDGEESGVDDDETIGSNEDDTVSVEQLANKLNYMGYSMSDVLKLFMDVRSDNEEKYTEEHCEGVNSTIIGIMDGTITLSSRDKRTYSSVLSGKNELYQETASPSTMTGTVEVSK